MTMISAAVPLAARCEAAHSAVPQRNGWRVTEMMPDARRAGVNSVARSRNCRFAPGKGSATAKRRAMTRSTLPSTGVAGRSNAIAAIAGYSWPGNVREVENTVKRAIVLGEALVIGTIGTAIGVAGGWTLGRGLVGVVEVAATVDGVPVVPLSAQTRQGRDDLWHVLAHPPFSVFQSSPP